MRKKSVKDIDVAGKRVFCRVDFNVPMEGGAITDDTRIRSAVPTIQYLVDHGAKVILASHMGRPKGRPEDKYRLNAPAARLADLLGKPVKKLDDCIGPDVQACVAAMRNGDVVMLENVRFYAGEEKNDPELAQQFAALADVFCNDAFGTAHRAHASTAGIANYVPVSVAGLLMQKELDFMGQALENPARPFTAIIGGAKVSDKIGVIENLLSKADNLLIGGGMANTFLRAKGFATGKSLVEEDKIDLAKSLLEKAAARGVKLLLPVDLVVAQEFKNDAERQVVADNAIPGGWMALDIGPKSMELYRQAVLGSKTVVWNGPMGVFEMPNFAHGTFGVAQALAEVDGITIVGGGDSVAAIEAANLAGRMSHISTGGGASLEFLEGKVLPGVACLADA